MRYSLRYRITIYAVFTVVLYLVLVGTVLPERYNLGVGQVSQATIIAPVDAVDVQATAAARAAAAALVPGRYDINPDVQQSAVAALDSLFAEAAALRAQAEAQTQLPSRFGLQQRRTTLPPGLTMADLEQLVTLSPSLFQRVSSDSIRITQQILQLPFSTTDMARAPMTVDSQLVNLDVDKSTRLIIGRIVSAVLRPNLVYDAVLTEQARLQAERNVPDIWINRGDVIVRRGQLITGTVMGQLQDLKLLKAVPDYGIFVAFFFLLALLTGAMATFIQLRRARVARDNLYLLLYTVIIVFIAVIIRVAVAGVDAGLTSDVAYAVPVAMGSMMITLFFGSSLAMLSSLLLAILAGSAFGFSFPHFFTPLIGALGATMAMNRVHHRSVFMRAGFLTAGLNVVTISTMHFLFTSTTAGWGVFGYQLLYGIVGGLLSAILTIGLLPYLEAVFGVITHMGLLELANPNNPLLRKLLLEAPGTYHHSLIVGNLAESAAEVIGADALVCRVGSYYHDVGKMKRPLFFIENQLGGENPHDRVAPNLSYLIVTAHVSDGLEMLREHKLPEPVRAICAEHHGTTVLWYFYNKALEEDKHGAVTQDQFRYPGPKPQSKESAIVMMCDAVEASVRSISKPTPPRIEAMIRKIIKDRLQDGQLDQCDITLRDLDRMVEAFMRTLQGIYHERIEYPDPAKIGAVKE
ncbi:MAG: HDIG domain-containing protein [Firmicutes bacterium]|nr:HDIG domain-containing protein [Bacillota bacterium]